MAAQLVYLNGHGFLVDQAQLEQFIKDTKEDWVKVTEWIEAVGTPIRGNSIMEEEARNLFDRISIDSNNFKFGGN